MASSALSQRLRTSGGRAFTTGRTRVVMQASTALPKQVCITVSSASSPIGPGRAMHTAMYIA